MMMLPSVTHHDGRYAIYGVVSYRLASHPSGSQTAGAGGAGGKQRSRDSHVSALTALELAIAMDSAHLQLCNTCPNIHSLFGDAYDAYAHLPDDPNREKYTLGRVCPPAALVKTDGATPGLAEFVENAVSQVETRIASFLSPRDNANVGCASRHPFRSLRTFRGSTYIGPSLDPSLSYRLAVVEASFRVSMWKGFLATCTTKQHPFAGATGIHRVSSRRDESGGARCHRFQSTPRHEEEGGSGGAEDDDVEGFGVRMNKLGAKFSFTAAAPTEAHRLSFHPHERRRLRPRCHRSKSAPRLEEEGAEGVEDDVDGFGVRMNKLGDGFSFTSAASTEARVVSLFDIAAANLHWVRVDLLATEMDVEHRGPTGLFLNPISAAASQNALSEYAAEVSPAALDQSGVCACCGAMVSRTNPTNVIDFASDKDLMDDLFKHANICHQGIPAVYLTPVPDDQLAAARKRLPLPCFKGSNKDRAENLRGGTSKVWLGDYVNVCYADENSDQAEVRANASPSSEWSETTWVDSDPIVVLGYIAALGRDGAHHVVLEQGPDCPTLQDRPATHHECRGGLQCPFRLMFHGLYGYGTRTDENDRAAEEAYDDYVYGGMSQSTFRDRIQTLSMRHMYILLDDREFEKGAGMDGDDKKRNIWRRDGFDVDAWEKHGTKMRVCSTCKTSLVKAKTAKSKVDVVTAALTTAQTKAAAAVDGELLVTGAEAITRASKLRSKLAAEVATLAAKKRVLCDTYMKACPAVAIVRLEQNYVPLPYVFEDGGEQYSHCSDASCRCRLVGSVEDLWPSDAAFIEKHIRLLEEMPEDCLTALSPVRNRGKVVRLIPSSQQGRRAEKRGLTALEAATEPGSKVISAKHTHGGSASGLQRMLAGNSIPFDQDASGMALELGDERAPLHQAYDVHQVEYGLDVQEMMNHLGPGAILSGETSLKDSLASRKVVLVSPDELKADLLRDVDNAAEFALPVDVGRGYARVFRLYHPMVRKDRDDNVLGTERVVPSECLGELYILGKDRETPRNTRVRSKWEPDKGADVWYTLPRESTWNTLQSNSPVSSAADGEEGATEDQTYEAERVAAKVDAIDATTTPTMYTLKHEDQASHPGEVVTDIGNLAPRTPGLYAKRVEAMIRGATAGVSAGTGDGGGCSGKTRSGLVQVSDALMDGSSLLRTAASNLARKLRQERRKTEGPAKPDGDLIYSVHSQVPLCDFQRISQLLTGMYPHHFPQGRGGHYDPYRRHNYISKMEWKQHTYGRAANRSKATDAMLLVHQNIEMKAAMAVQAQIMFKDRKNGARTLAATDVSSKVLLEVVTMLATGATREEVVQQYPGHQYLLTMIKAVSGRVKGTAHSRKQTRINVQGLAAEKGVTNVWFTLNPDEAGDFNLAMHAGFSKETARLVKSKRVERAWLSTLAARDPAALAKWFDRICHSLIKHVFGFDVKSNNSRRRGGPGRRGMFGTVNGYFAPVECAQRGGLHSHWTIWIEEMGVLRDILADPSLAGLIAGTASRFFDSIVSAELRACRGVYNNKLAGAMPRVEVLSGKDAEQLDLCPTPNVPNSWVMKTDPSSGESYTSMSPVVAPPVPLPIRAGKEGTSGDGAAVPVSAPRTTSSRSNAHSPVETIHGFDAEVVRGFSVAKPVTSSRWQEPVHGRDVEQRGLDILNRRAAASYFIQAWFAVVIRRSNGPALCSQPSPHSPPVLSSRPGLTTRSTAAPPSLEDRMSYILVKLTRAQPAAVAAVAKTKPRSQVKQRESAAANVWKEDTTAALRDKIMSYITNPQDEYDARYVGEGGRLVVDQCLHGKREKNWTKHSAKGGLDHLSNYVRTCHVGCFKTKTAKKNMACRFGYNKAGKVTLQVTRFNDNGSIEYKRDFAHVVPHFKGGILTFRTNMCFEILFMGADAAALFEVRRGFNNDGQVCAPPPPSPHAPTHTHTHTRTSACVVLPYLIGPLCSGTYPFVVSVSPSLPSPPCPALDSPFVPLYPVYHVLSGQG